MKRLLALVVLLVLAATGCAADDLSSQHAGQEPSVAAAEVGASAPTAGSTGHPDPVRPTSLELWKFDARVVPLELTGTELVPPSDPSVVGWWGKRAGAATGTTLLTGHTVHTGGGELDDLELTPVGAKARVSGIDYEVVSVKVISKAQLARRAPRLFAQEGAPKLVVVTCEGYDASTGHYTDNVVVTARPATSQTATHQR